jgi:hypothetical protein
MQKLVGTLIAIALGVGLFMYRSSQRDKVEARVDAMPERVMEVCKRTQGYSQYEDYVKKHAPHALDHALSVAYEAGGRRRTAKLDSKKFALAFAEDIARQGKLTRIDQKLDLFLRQLQIDLEQAAERGEFDEK